MKKYLALVLAGMLLVLGNGCSENNVRRDGSSDNDIKDTSVPSITVGGISLYVRSLDQSSKSILAAGKELNITEYKSSELIEKNKIQTLFLTIPNKNTTQFGQILLKEANDKNVYGLKNLYGDFSAQERPINGTTNFEIKLIDVSIL